MDIALPVQEQTQYTRRWRCQKIRERISFPLVGSVRSAHWAGAFSWHAGAVAWCQGHPAGEQTGAQGHSVMERSCTLQDMCLPTVAALFRVLMRRESPWQQGWPRAVSGRSGKVRGHCKHSGLGALTTEFGAGLVLVGVQFGFEDDMRHLMTGPSRDTSTTLSIHRQNHAPCKWP